MRRLILSFSIVLNLVAGGLLLHLASKPARPGTIHTQAARSTVLGAYSNRPPSASAHLPQNPANGFGWQVLESRSHDQVVANLRAIGCPERTIRQIIVPRVERDYAGKIASLPGRPAFWSAGPARTRAVAALEEQERAVEAEKRALLLRLVSFDCCGEDRGDRRDLIDQAISRFVLGPLPEGVTEQVLAVMKRREGLVDEIQKQANGLLLPEDETRVMQCREQELAELKQTLTPAQFEEFTARAAGFNLMDHGMEHLEVTSGEMRHIARLHATIFEMGSQRPFDLFSSHDEPEEKMQQFEAELLAYLGEVRFAQYKLARNPRDASAAQTGVAK